MILGIIPARGGSKGIPGKNMVDLHGRPLISYTFEVAQASRQLDRVILSTDIAEAIELARHQYPRVEAPFVRPAELCQDKTPMAAVLEHVLAFLQEQHAAPPTALVLLQPTSPFRTVTDVDKAVKTFQENRLDSLVGVSRAIHHPAEYVYREKLGAERFHWVMPSTKWRRRQDYPDIYFINGALYICTPGFFRETGNLFDQRSCLFTMSESTLIDIDDDFTLALARAWMISRDQSSAIV